MKVEIVVTSPWGIKRAREAFERLVYVPDLTSVAVAFLSAAEHYRQQRYKKTPREFARCKDCEHSNAKWTGDGFHCRCGCRCKDFWIFGVLPGQSRKRAR